MTFIREIVSHFTLYSVGCACPDPDTDELEDEQNGIVHVRQMELWRVYDGGLMDIGEICDDIELVCRSQRAMCLMEKRHDSGVTTVRRGRCTCPVNSVAVYQTNLRYHECFNRTERNSNEAVHSCLACQLDGGECYDIDNDGLNDGCQYPTVRSNAPDLRTNDNPRTLCQRVQVLTHCTSLGVTVCLIPHGSHRPIDGCLPLKQLPTQWFARILVPTRSHQRQMNQRCELQPVEKFTIGNEKILGMLPDSGTNALCAQLNRQLKEEFLCGTKLTQNYSCDTFITHQQTTYYGRLEAYSALGRISQTILFYCKADVPCIPHPDNLEEQSIFSYKLQILNEKFENVDSINESSIVRLKISSKASSTPVSIGFCVAMATFHLPSNLLGLKTILLRHRMNRCFSEVNYKTVSNYGKSKYEFVDLWPIWWTLEPSRNLSYMSSPIITTKVLPNWRIAQFICQVHVCIQANCDTILVK
ncbi:unnamed protein product [Dicrocoelium dendriticum]|nr:unnamed protein product [Dicrocoelium dendriticum]